MANGVLEKLSALVKEREGIQRKLSTTYSLGRDGAGLPPKSSLLPLYDGRSRSYSFQGARKESVTIFHTYSSDTCSSNGSSEDGSDEDMHEEVEFIVKAKGKAPIEVHSSSDDDDFYETQHKISPTSVSGSSSRRFQNPLFTVNSFHEIDEARKIEEGLKQEIAGTGNRSIRRRALSSSN